MLNQLLWLIRPILPADTLNVADGIVSAFDENVKPQFQTIVNKVVMPIICGVLLVALIAKAVFVWNEYHNSGGAKYGVLIVLFICLVVSVSATAWMWNVIGW